MTAPFWFAFAGSAVILALIWRELGHIAHADEREAARLERLAEELAETTTEKDRLLIAQKLADRPAAQPPATPLAARAATVAA